VSPWLDTGTILFPETDWGIIYTHSLLISYEDGDSINTMTFIKEMNKPLGRFKSRLRSVYNDTNQRFLRLLYIQRLRFMRQEVHHMTPYGTRQISLVQVF
jgi:hypothetical protein